MATFFPPTRKTFQNLIRCSDFVKSPNGLLISLSGIDGSGKSTIAKKLGDYFYAEYGLPSHNLWCKFGSHPLSTLRLSSITNKSRFCQRSRTKRSLSPHLIPQLYARALLSLHLAHIFLVVRRNQQNGVIVICDRYIFDTMVDLRQEFRYPMAKIREIFSIEWLPRPDSKFLFDLPPKVAFQRKPDTESEVFLRQRRFLYKRIAKEYDLHMIDARQAPDIVFGQVTEMINGENFIGANQGIWHG